VKFATFFAAFGDRREQVSDPRWMFLPAGRWDIEKYKGILIAGQKKGIFTVVFPGNSIVHEKNSFFIRN
jgi:hypothetical protein